MPGDRSWKTCCTFDFDPNQVQAGSRAIAQLHFDTAATGGSSIANLLIDALTGARLDGEKLTDTSARAGRLFLVEVEPLLDIVAAAERVKLTLFGKPGTRYMLQRSEGLSGRAWADDQLITFGGGAQAVERSVADSASTFYRLIER